MGNCASSTVVTSRALVAPEGAVASKASTKVLQTSTRVDDEGKDSTNTDSNTKALTGDSVDVRVGVAAAIGTAGIIHDAVRFEDSTSGALILEAGAALLEVFEHVPFVAPAAFLIGAVARASMEAVVLREDCMAYAETTKRVERVMLKAKHMESQRETVEIVINVLEDSLTLVKHLATRGMVASVVRSCKDAKKLAEYKDELVEAVSLLQLECTLELNAMKQIELNQAKELEKRIEELGGIEECATCKEKTAALSDCLSRGDALMLSKMDNLTEQTRTSINEMAGGIDQLAKVQSNALKRVDSHFLKVQQEAEKAALRSAVLEEQVSTLANALVEVKDMLKSCPVPTNEPTRLIAIRESGAMVMTPNSEAWDCVDNCALDVYNIMGGAVCVAINFISEDTSHFPMFYLPSPEDGLSKPVNVAANDAEFVTSPRKANVCQHVVHRAETVEFVGMQNAPPQLTPSQFQLVSLLDPTIVSKMEENKGKGVVCDKNHGCPFNSVWWDLQVNATNSVWYRGQPIFCNGLAIGSFCCVSPDGKPKDFDLRVKPLVEVNVARIGLALERQALGTKEKDLFELAMAVCPNTKLRVSSPLSSNESFHGHMQDTSKVSTNTFFQAEDLVNFVH